MRILGEERGLVADWDRGADLGLATAYRTLLQKKLSPKGLPTDYYYHCCFARAIILRTREMTLCGLGEKIRIRNTAGSSTACDYQAYFLMVSRHYDDSLDK